MATVTGRDGRRPRHTTLTATAERAYSALRRAGMHPHPGFINGRAGASQPRIAVTVEQGRVRIGISGQAHQELHIYGPVEPSSLLECLREEFGNEAVSVRDPGALWPEAAETHPCP